MVIQPIAKYSRWKGNAGKFLTCANAVAQQEPAYEVISSGTDSYDEQNPMGYANTLARLAVGLSHAHCKHCCELCACVLGLRTS